MPEKINHPAKRFIYNVMNRKITVCKFVIAAVERHVRDLKTGGSRGLYFDEIEAQHAIDFYKFLRHSKGEWAGKVLELSDWQQFINWVLFGWKKEDGTRRFRTAYIEVARKNGKSTMSSGNGLYLFCADGEMGAEVYTAATKKDQAKITHSESTRMVKSSPSLRKRIDIKKDNLNIQKTNSKYEPLGADADTLDGLNLSGGIIDELHAHKTRDLWDVLETATGSRRQPLIIAITTAGHNRYSVCWEQRDYVRQILQGVIEDDSYFGIIFTLDMKYDWPELKKDDDWENEENWMKANPNLNVSCKIDDLRRKAIKAKAMPTALNSFLRLHLNIWTQAESRWMSQEKWNNCGKIEFKEEDLFGRTVYAGIDISSTTDISALVVVVTPEKEDDPFYIIPRFYIPRENMLQRIKRDKVPYDAWWREGYLVATPGDVIDYDYILEDLDYFLKNFNFAEVAIDRWGATQFIQDLHDKNGEDWVVGFGQGFASMSGPTKELGKKILSEKIAHGGNPVLSWMANNVVVKEDPAGNIKPDKSKSSEKIDGIVALIMGIARAILKKGNKKSVYEERGVLAL